MKDTDLIDTDARPKQYETKYHIVTRTLSPCSEITKYLCQLTIAKLRFWHDASKWVILTRDFFVRTTLHEWVCIILLNQKLLDLEPVVIKIEIITHNFAYFDLRHDVIHKGYNFENWPFETVDNINRYKITVTKQVDNNIVFNACVRRTSKMMRTIS